MIVRDMPFEAEAVKQRLLHHPPLAHHGRISRAQRKESATAASIKRSSSTKSVGPISSQLAVETRHNQPAVRREGEAVDVIAIVAVGQQLFAGCAVEDAHAVVSAEPDGDAPPVG